MGKGLLHNSTGGNTGNVGTAGKGTSAPQNTSVGSGSRPVRSTYPIATGAADNPKTQGREPAKDPGVLK